MCGIAGLVSPRGVDRALAERFAGALRHRGPDDGGLWVDERSVVALAHRRLAIVDLSPGGHQPMVSRSGRWVLCYNGEVYNHAEVRREIEQSGGGTAWRGTSDTETLVEAIDLWGLEAALRRMVGMFAFALFDVAQRRLFLVRDRFGEKPLYYGWASEDLVWGSELKALRQHPRFDRALNREAVAALASRNYIPAPLSIHARVFKLEPGCILSVAIDALPPCPSQPPRAPYRDGICIDRYWSYPDVLSEGRRNLFASEDEALEAVGDALDTSLKGQMVADVPVGAFLSGGIDSSLIVARYQSLSGSPVHTFTIGTKDGFDEAGYAKAVAAHLGTHHTELYVDANDARDLIPMLPAMYDEPFADPSQMPTFLVSRLARDHVTVALSGDAGDELFGGYNRYFGVARAWNAFARVPAPLRRPAARLLAAVPPDLWTRGVNAISKHPRGGNFGTKARRTFRNLADGRDFDGFFAAFLDDWSGRGDPVIGGAARFPAAVSHAWPDTALRMMEADALDYLPGDILTKVDRSAMAVSLETRVPFLDHRLAAVAARVPIAMNIQGGRGKLLLRKLLYRDVPPALIERPKAGFGVPVGAWLRGPLRDWGEELLAPARLRDTGLWDAKVVRGLWDDHQAGRADGTHPLWSVLMFQAWQEAQGAA